MNALVQRIFGNPKTTLGGLGFGALFAGIGTAILTQAGCDFSQVKWWEIFLMLWSGPAAVGAAATDAGKG